MHVRSNKLQKRLVISTSLTCVSLNIRDRYSNETYGEHDPGWKHGHKRTAQTLQEEMRISSPVKLRS